MTYAHPKKTDQLGLAYVVSDSADLINKSVTGFWCHYGKDEKWGTRTWIQGNWDNQDTQNIVFDSIWAQNPTFSEYSSPWIVGRNRGDMYDKAIVENPLDAERVPLGNRSKGGFVGDLKGFYSDETYI